MTGDDSRVIHVGRENLIQIARRLPSPRRCGERRSSWVRRS